MEELYELFSTENVEKWEKEITRKERLRTYGKLGGRPLIGDSKKTEKITIRLSPKEKKQLKEKAEKSKLSLPEFFRRSAMEKPLPNADRNKVLLEYRTNFKRLSNFFSSSIWTIEERTKFKEEISHLISKIEQSL